MKRIPYPQPLIPVSAFENQGLETNTNLMPSFVTERPLDYLERERQRRLITPWPLDSREFQHRFDPVRYYYMHGYHMYSGLQQDIALDALRERSNRSAIVPSGTVNVRHLNNVASFQQTQQLSESLNIDNDSDDPERMLIASANLSRILPNEGRNNRGSYLYDSLQPQQECLRGRHLADGAISNRNGHQADTYVALPFPEQPERHFQYARSHQAGDFPFTPAEMGRRHSRL